MFTTEVERCIVPASQHHRVNHLVLRAILNVESRLNPKAVGKNDNGTLDVGIGQMNSIHFKELAKHGIGVDQLKDACVGTYVAAWHLSKMIAKHGNTWYGIAAYHSATPYFNNRYQILLRNEMVKSGSMEGKLQPVPSLRPGPKAGRTTARAKTPSQSATVVASSPSLVMDTTP